jgi:diaminobutyrate-2-oxoglutarate transaminase
VGSLLVFRALTQARLPPLQDAGAADSPVWQALLAKLRAASRWFVRQMDMGRLLAYTSIQKGLLTLVASMMTPLVLSTHSASVLGVVMTAAAAGGVLGSLSLALLNLRRHLVTWVLLLDAFLSLCVVAVGLSQSPLWWGLGAFLAAFAGSMSEACAGTVWMRQAPPAQRASVLSLVSMSGMLTVSLVLLVGGAFSEQVLEPAMAAQGAWAAFLGPWLGTGPGRGIGLLFVGCGGACFVISVLAFLGAGMRHEPSATASAGQQPS